MYPKPVQDPHPPIYIGGESDAALRRVADFGNGWHGFNHLPDSAAASVQRLERALASVGRALDDIDVTIGAYLQPVEPKHLAGYRDAGVDQLVLTAFAGDAAGIRDEVARLGDAFVGPAVEL
jgi:alkanesulfonate monooxygenase SsuD/methylene tetrahydromethanopterin reductase-like flavin-dependent oxidoreductase (luciferase family)